MKSTLNWDQLALPVIRIGTSCRLVSTLEELGMVRENALPPPGRNRVSEPQYFWDSTGKWYAAVEIKKVKAAPFWVRFFGADDLMVATFKLTELPEPPDRWLGERRGFLQLLRFDWIGKPEMIKLGVSRLKQCQTHADYVDWMREFKKPGKGHGY